MSVICLESCRNLITQLLTGFILQEAGFSFVELNASDTRSKKSLKEEVAEALNNHSLAGIFGMYICVYLGMQDWMISTFILIRVMK